MLILQMSPPIEAHRCLENTMWRVFAILQLEMRLPKKRLLAEHADRVVHTEAAKGAADCRLSEVQGTDESQLAL